MNYDQREYDIKQRLIAALDMIASLNQAVTSAGGIPMSIHALKEISVLDLVLNLSPNDIRFVHLERIESKEKP